MGKWSVKKLGFTLCTMLLVIIVGCQSVGGLNLNEMLLKQIDVTQQEQSQLLEIEVELNEQLLSEDESEFTELMKIIEKLSLNIKHSKLDDKGNFWMTGEFSFYKGVIPFTVQTDSKAVRIDLEGASRPLIIEMDSLGASSLSELIPGLDMSVGSEDQQVLMDSVRKLIRNVGSYFVKGLPNPSTLSVSRMMEPINGVTISLNKVHAELNGEQLGELVSVYLDNLISDEEGFRAMLAHVVQWIVELPPELQALFGDAEIFEEGFDANAFVEEGVAELFPLLVEAKEELAAARKGEEWNEIFDKGITMVADVYVDDSLHVRKSVMELVIAPAAFLKEDSPVRKITIRSSGEMWSVNGDVEIPALEIPLNGLNVEQLDRLKPYQIVSLFDESSVIYDILKNDFKLDDQVFYLSSEWGVPFFIDDHEEIFVPVRSTMVNFDVETTFNFNTEEIQFYDDATRQGIRLQVGSSTAYVNGKEVPLVHKVLYDGHFVYVSADDLFGLLRAEYEIIDTGYDELEMVVTRDL
jgi:hypothetical protein